MRKGISPLIAAVILIAFVVAVAGVASGFFTGFFKKRQSEIEEKGETTVSCGVANLEIQENILKCSAPNWDSMVGRWHFEQTDGTNGTAVHDSSSNSNTGTLRLNSTTQDATAGGKFGKALEFDGSDDYVEVPDDASLNFGNFTDFSIAFWFKGTQQKDSQGMIHKMNGYGEGYSVVNNDPFGFWLRVEDNEGDAATAKASPADYFDGSWHLLTFIADRDVNITAYVDTQERQTKSMTGVGNITWGGNLQIGKSSVSNPYLNGTIDEVRVYDRALSQSQIEYLYAHGTHLRFPIWNKGQTSLGKKFGVTAIINGTSVSGSVSLDNSLDKAQIQTVTALENISTAGKLEKVRVASKACGNVKDITEPSGVYC